MAKLTDFGIARLLLGSPRLTMDDTAVGTPNYVSPEQVEGAPAGPASDIYSLGLVLLECLTGQLATSLLPSSGHGHHSPAPTPVPSRYPRVGGHLGSDVHRLEVLIP